MKKCIKLFYKIFSILYFLISLLTTNSCHPQLNPKVETQNKWTKLMGVNSVSTIAYGIDDDSKGYIYLSGYTDGPLDGQILNGTRDLLLIKFAPDGEKLFTKLFGVTSGQTLSLNIAIDKKNNFIYLTGYTNGNLNGVSKTGIEDGFLIKLDLNGNLIWTKLFGSTSANVYSNNICLDSEGNIYLIGETTGSLNGQPLNGTMDGFLIKFDKEGNIIWTQLLGINSSETSCKGISIYKNNIYISGYTEGNLDGQIKTGLIDSFLIKYDLNGNKKWTKLFGAVGAQTYNMSIDIDLYENIYVTGYTNGNLDGQIKTGNIDLFLIKFNSFGEKLFTKLFGAPSGEVDPFCLKIDKENNILISGKTDSNLDGIYKNGLWDTFLIKYSSNGIKKWTKLLGTTGASTFPQSMKILSKNNIFIIGCTNGNLDGQIKSGTLDLFITNILSE